MIKNTEINKEKGITLIALVITIIVLLILAGVTIQTLTGDNGLLGKTSESKFITEIQHYNEELKLAITEDYTNSMGNRQNKFNVRRSSYNDENSFTNAMKTKIPSFNSKYVNKLEIKEDKLNYIGEDEQERAWLAQAISVAGMLKINYVYENGTEAAPTYQKVITDGSYEVESPAISGYEPDHYIISGEINGDTNIVVTYYGESQGLVYEELNDGTYTVAGPSSYSGDILVIPKEYNGKAVTEVKQSAFQNNNTINTLIIPNINDIKKNAFRNCSNLEYINIDAKKISPQFAFYSDINLKQIIIGSNMESIDGSAFHNCTNLETVIMNSEKATLTGGMFGGCNNLKFIDIAKDNSAFKYKDGIVCSKNEEIIYMYLPSNTNEEYIIPANIKTINGDAFRNNNILKKIEIGNNVNVIGSKAFQDCTNLEEIIVDAKNIYNQFTFYNNIKLKKVTIGTNVEKIVGSTFGNCTSIEKFNYLGTKEQWNNITKASDWNTLSSITQVICTDGTVNL